MVRAKVIETAEKPSVWAANQLRTLLGEHQWNGMTESFVSVKKESLLALLGRVRSEERERCAKVCEGWAAYQAQLLEREKVNGREGEWFALTCAAEQSAARHLAAAIRKEPGE